MMSSNQTLHLILAVAMALCQAGCQKPEAPVTVPRKTFTVKGVVQEIKNDGKTLVIDHEEMPGYMRAMIMPFKVKDAKLSAGLKPGDEVMLEYVVEETSSWIEAIQRTGNTGPIKIKQVPPMEEPLKTGDVLPDYRFLDENGQAVKLSDFRGQVVALTFVFTRCPVPEYCPAMMRQFAAVDQALKKEAGVPGKWRLLTLSFDHVFDKPEVMKAYGVNFGHEPSHWSLLTATDAETITKIGANVGLKFGEVHGTYQHNLRTVVLTPEGRIQRMFLDETWKPEELIAEMKLAGAN